MSGWAMKKYLTGRTELPYDAFAADEAWLCPYEDGKEGEKTHDTETEKIQTDEVHGEDLAL